MERKIGEIFEYNGEWYQCVNGFECTKCDLHQNKRCTARYNDIGSCSKYSRKDNTPVIFKKLEKVGEPYTFVDKTVQNYLLEADISASPEDVFILTNNKLRLIAIEIKQNKEDMEEKVLKCTRKEADILINRVLNIVSDYTDKDNESIASKIEEYLDIQEESKPILKEFDLEAAKAGKPVCTRDGRKARIICFDAKDTQPIIGLYEKDINGITREYLCSYHIDGRMYDDQDTGYDLMILPEKKEGWYNVYKSCIYSTREEAEKVGEKSCDFIKTLKVEWEE